MVLVAVITLWSLSLVRHCQESVVSTENVNLKNNKEEMDELPTEATEQSHADSASSQLLNDFGDSS
jgi:hypothetical protein